MGGSALATLALAIAATSASPPATGAETWVPTGYDEHERAAWALLQLVCGPDAPDRYQGPLPADECAQNLDVTLLWLQMLKAWAELPENAGDAAALQRFPELEPAVMRHLRDLAATAEPTWVIEPHEDMLRAPVVVRGQLLDVARLSYDMQQRLSITRALIHEPELILMDEPTSGLAPESAEGSAVEGSATGAASDDAALVPDASGTE